MLATLILGIAAGAATPYAEPRMKEAIESMLLDDAPLTEMELRLFTFAMLVVVAAVLSMIFGNPHAVPLALGAAVGIFGPRLIDAWNARKRPDYDS